MKNDRKGVLHVAQTSGGIIFSVPESISIISIYDLKGQKMISLSTASWTNSGKFFWNCTGIDGERVKAGKYIAVCNSKSTIQRVIFIVH